MDKVIVVRDFTKTDAPAVRSLFIRVNRRLAPPEMKSAFETYITASLREEIDRISDYYEDRKGQFRVAVSGQKIVGMFGLEPSGPDAMELRRMYVDPDWRRRGIAAQMLRDAENFCRARALTRLDLSTSEIQSDALSFYRASGYRLVREETAEAPSNKTIGGGIRRYHFSRDLLLPGAA